MERPLDELDHLYYRNVIRGTKLMIAKRNLDKNKELARLPNNTSSNQRK